MYFTLKRLEDKAGGRPSAVDPGDKLKLERSNARAAIHLANENRAGAFDGALDRPFSGGRVARETAREIMPVASTTE
jgi:hypothetical protein